MIYERGNTAYIYRNECEILEFDWSRSNIDRVFIITAVGGYNEPRSSISLYERVDTPLIMHPILDNQSEGIDTLCTTWTKSYMYMNNTTVTTEYIPVVITKDDK